MTFHAVIQCTINPILNPTDCKKLQSRVSLATDLLAIDVKTVAPFARQCFLNAELHAPVLHKFL
ncbi:hypothetical protein XH92_37360 [Bradyrhizobium sp. CCBAU 53421]|nr:hypothetical protein XH92_37360 [Bradyrhizobium sp. CCBAU 53421]